MLTLLKKHFGYDEFLPMQEEVIDNVLARKDALVLMPTGGGKSLCYQLPALTFDGLTLVVSPLIALMKDQVDALKANGIAAGFINSTLSNAEIIRVQAEANNGRLKILYVAPERLALQGFRSFLHSLEVSLIAIDEAHCISEWGHDFRPDYRNLKALRRDFPAVPVIALTATATERVREDIVAQLNLEHARVFISSFNRANLNYNVRPKRNAFDTLLRLLKRHESGPAIIYCFSRKDTENLAADLSAQGLNALPYHAGLEPSVRTSTQEKFIRDEVSIIAATIAFGMGVDKPDIRLLVHYDLPKSLGGYYQETGRAGRDGLPSECVLFYSYGDKIKQDFFIDQVEDDLERENARQKLAQIIEFCELNTCRRRYVLEYFGETWDEEYCGGCDVCLTPTEEFDATVIAQKILSAVIRTNERFGVNHVIEVLRGAKTRRVRELGHDQLSVYGIVREFDDDGLKQVISLLLTKELLEKSGSEYPTLAVTQTGRRFLSQREQLMLAKPVSDPEFDAPQKAESLDHNQELFDKLRDLRTTIAQSRGLPPYMIFSDTTLQLMASSFPQSRESLSRISGVGTVKLEELGEDFLTVIRTHARLHGLAERSIPTRRRRERTPRVQREGSTYDVTRQLFAQKKSVMEIAKERNLALNTIFSHLEKLIESGDDLDISHVALPPERFAKIQAAFHHAKTMMLTPVQELLGVGYSFEELRLARLHLMHERRLQ